MDLRALERRQDPRRATFVPITLHYDGHEAQTPAHLLDLSTGGAAVLTTAYNAPSLGQYLDVLFEAPNNDGGTETRYQRETGLVVNMASPERGVSRVGIRFLHRPDIDCGLLDPIDLLSSHKKTKPAKETASRWETARNFKQHEPFATKAGATAN